RTCAGAAAAAIAFVLSCSSATPRVPNSGSERPVATATPEQVSPRTAPIDPREYYFPYLNPLRVWGRLCICGDCDHAQWDGPGSKPIRGTGVFAPGLETLQCGQPLLTGTLLGATGQVQSLVQT